MNTETIFEYKTLEQENVGFYQNLTYPKYRNQLQDLDSSAVLAIGVEQGSIPVGLVLANYSSADQTGTILSLFVVPEYRAQGIGSKLLAKMEQLLAQKDCTEIKLVYAQNCNSVYLEKVLAKSKWNTPQTRMLLAHTNSISSDNQPLVDVVKDYLQRSPLPTEFTIFPWNQVKPIELDTIQSQESIIYPANLSPLQETEHIDHSNSLGLRYRGEIVGWMVTHRSAPDVVRYTSLFVREDLRRVGRAIPPWTLLFESILLQAKHNQVAKASFTVWNDNSRMLRIVERRIAPFLHSISYSMGTSKLIEVL